MAVELFFDSTASGSRTVFRFYCRFLVAEEVAVEMAVEFKSGSRNKIGSRKAGHQVYLIIHMYQYISTDVEFDSEFEYVGKKILRPRI